VRAALKHLLEARRGALTLKADVWSFAVEMAYLLGAGCTVTQLRLLVAAGFAEHAEDVTPPSEPERSFRPEPRLAFGPWTCFVLTAAGAAWVARLEEESDPGAGKRNGPVGRRVPRWSATARELRVDGRVLKRFRRPAPNLELVLAAFEEEGWPRHLDDPLPPEHGIDPQARLRDTVRRLNACQEPHKIRFESDGLGSGIRWGWADQEHEVCHG
jgi:hypothetical protein